MIKQGLLLSSCLFCSLAQAEVILDGTVGPRGSVPGPDYQIGADLGRQVGGNLFHSFSVFNVWADESATFSGPESVNHIICRVTGGSPSHILGLIRSTIPGSQVWIFNPAGLEYAGISDVPGGVAAATATALTLKDGGLYDALNPQNSVLTVAPPQTFLLSYPPPPPPASDGGPAEEEQETQEQEEETNFLLSPAVSARIIEEPLACGKRQGTEISRFTHSHFSGSPQSPDDWQASPLLPISSQPAEQAAAVDPAQAVSLKVKCDAVTCNISAAVVN